MSSSSHPAGVPLTPAGQFVALGVEWYDHFDDPQRRARLEDAAVLLLREHKDAMPDLNRLKRDVRNVSFLPSVVETLWRRAYPPTVEDRAHDRPEWDALCAAANQVSTLRAAGDHEQAEALRTSAVTFFKRWLTGDDDVTDWLRQQARLRLRKPRLPGPR